MSNRLTPLYSKIHYKEENYLKVKTTVFKYITPPIVKVEYVGILVYWYVISLYSYIPMFQTLVTCCLCDSATPYPMALLVLSVLHLAY